MASHRIVLALGSAMLLAVAIFFAANNLHTSPQPAVAGPCGDLARLYEDWKDPTGPNHDKYVKSLDLTDWPRGRIRFTYDFQVFTDPNRLPPGKPPVTIEVQEIQGDPNLSVKVYPGTPDYSQNGSFVTTLAITIKGPLGVGVYKYALVMKCHGEMSTVPLDFSIFDCAGEPNAAVNLFEPAGDQCTAQTPTPTPIVTASVLQKDLVWGSIDCAPGQSPIEALLIFLNKILPAPSPTPGPGDCPQLGETVYVGDAGPLAWGDWTCDEEINEKDGLAWLKWIALLQQLGLAPCPPVGVPVKVGSYYLLPD